MSCKQKKQTPPLCSWDLYLSKGQEIRSGSRAVAVCCPALSSASLPSLARQQMLLCLLGPEIMHLRTSNKVKPQEGPAHRVRCRKITVPLALTLS